MLQQDDERKRAEAARRAAQERAEKAAQDKAAAESAAKEKVVLSLPTRFGNVDIVNLTDSSQI